jgi:putative acetyltransferase
MIRPYTSGDIKGLLEVWDRASRIAHPFLVEEFLEAEKVEIAQRWLPIAETTVYEIDGRVVGFIALIGNEVGGFFVDPDLQGRGIGRALMDHARRSRPLLELDVFEANVIGRRFYDAYGFRLVDRHLNVESGQLELRLQLG